MQLYINNYGVILNCKASHSNPNFFPILHTISKSFEKMSDTYTEYMENYKCAFLVENSRMTRNIEGREIIGKRFFTREFFETNATKILQLKYCDFYNSDGDLIPARNVVENTGIPLTAIMIQTLRGVCTVAKVKFSEKPIERKKSIDLFTFLQRYQKGSSHLRKIMSYTKSTEIPHNIVKFSNNMDIVISENQSKFLNQLWTNNFFTSSMKTFLFKLHNNTLGYNIAVAHFVRGHSPLCTFCDIARNQDINNENGLHLFFECSHVSDIVDSIFSRITGIANFDFSSREFFATFERREFSFAKNYLLTLAAKLTMKIIWDYRNRYCIPNLEGVWENITDEIKGLRRGNKKFQRLWDVSGLLDFFP